MHAGGVRPPVGNIHALCVLPTMSDTAKATSPRKRARVDVSSDGKKIALLTGALGGIGSATAAVLRESGYEVIGMDRSEGESAADHFLQCDIRAFHADANSVRLS